MSFENSLEWRVVWWGRPHVEAKDPFRQDSLGPHRAVFSHSKWGWLVTSGCGAENVMRELAVTLWALVCSGGESLLCNSGWLSFCSPSAALWNAVAIRWSPWCLILLPVAIVSCCFLRWLSCLTFCKTTWIIEVWSVHFGSTGLTWMISAIHCSSGLICLGWRRDCDGDLLLLSRYPKLYPRSLWVGRSWVSLFAVPACNELALQCCSSN